MTRQFGLPQRKREPWQRQVCTAAETGHILICSSSHPPFFIGLIWVKFGQIEFKRSQVAVIYWKPDQRWWSISIIRLLCDWCLPPSLTVIGWIHRRMTEKTRSLSSSLAHPPSSRSWNVAIDWGRKKNCVHETLNSRSSRGNEISRSSCHEISEFNWNIEYFYNLRKFLERDRPSESFWFVQEVYANVQYRY